MIYHLVWGISSSAEDGQIIPAYFGNYLKSIAPKATLLDGKRRLYFVDKEGASRKFLDMVRDPTTSDTFLFVLVKRLKQIETFDQFLKEHDLQEYVTFRSPIVTNPVHTGNGRQLQLVVMQTKNHFQKELIK